MPPPVYILKRNQRKLINDVLRKYKLTETDFELSSNAAAHYYKLKQEPRLYFLFQQGRNNLDKFTNVCTTFTPNFTPIDFSIGNTKKSVTIDEAVKRFENWLKSDAIPFINETSNFLDSRTETSTVSDVQIDIVPPIEGPVHAISIKEDDNRLRDQGLINVGLIGYIFDFPGEGRVALQAFEITYENSKIDYLYTTDVSSERLSRRNPFSLPIIGYVHTREENQHLRLKRFFNRETLDHVYTTTFIDFEDERKYVDESGGNPMFISRRALESTIPLYLYSNTPAKFKPSHYGDKPFSSQSDIEYTKDERIKELWKIIESRDLDPVGFSIPRLDDSTITVFVSKGVENFYINLQDSQEFFTVRINPARDNGDYIFNDVDSWQGVLVYFNEWLDSIDGDKQNPIKDLNEANGVRFLEGASGFTLRNESIKAVLNVETQAAIFFRLIESIPSSENGLLLGIFGKWGRGKTFFWQNLKNLFITLNLEAAKSKDQGSRPKLYEHVEFHAWKYQDTQASWAYLYEVCAKKFYERPLRFAFTKFIIPSKWLTRIINRFYLNISRFGWWNFIFGLLALLYGFVWYFFLDFENKWDLLSTVITFFGIGMLVSIFLYYYFYSDTAKRLIRQYFSEPSYQHLLGIQAEIQKELRFLFGTWVPKKKLSKKRIVLFVDDIDRCSEDRIIQVIDSLKVMMDDPFISQRVIVIAAIDESVLQRAIKLKYHDMVTRDLSLTKNQQKKTLEQLCREYIDKLFLNGFKLGALSNDDKAEVIKSITQDRISFRNEERKDEKFSGSSEKVVPDNENAEDESEVKAQEIDPPNKLETEREEDESDRNRSKEMKHETDPNKPSSRKKGNFIFMLPKEDFEIMDWELDYIIKAVSQSDYATPRSIRIFYYRYLLAKHFKEIVIRENTGVFNEWGDYENKEILCFMIAEFSGSKDQKQLHDEVSGISKENEQVTKTFLGQKFTLSRDLYLALLKVVEIVVPY